MTSASVHAAKTNLSRLIAEAESGEEVIIMRGTKPVVKLVAISPDAQRPRVFGALAGSVTVGDAFEEPLPESELARWEE